MSETKNPSGQLKSPSQPLIINVIPPEDDDLHGIRGSGPLNKKGQASFYFYKNSRPGSSNDNSLSNDPSNSPKETVDVETINSYNIFNNYYDQKVFRLNSALMTVIGWKPFLIKRRMLIYSEPMLRNRICNMVYPVLIITLYLLGVILNGRDNFYNFPSFSHGDAHRDAWSRSLTYFGGNKNGSQKIKEVGTGGSGNNLFGELVGKVTVYLPTIIGTIIPESIFLLFLIHGYYIFRYRDWEFFHMLLETAFTKLLPPLGEEAIESAGLNHLSPSESLNSRHFRRTKNSMYTKHEELRRTRAIKNYDTLYLYTMAWLMVLAVTTILDFNFGVQKILLANKNELNYITFAFIVHIITTLIGYIGLCIVMCMYILLVHCLIIMLEDVKERILNRQLELDVSKKELYKIKAWSKTLNSYLSIPLFLYYATCVLKTLGHIKILYALQRISPNASFSNYKYQSELDGLGANHLITLLALTCGFSLILLASLITYPLIQASRLTKIGKLAHYIGLEVASKPYGFYILSSSAIDSFLLFTSLLTISPKICWFNPKTSICYWLVMATLMIYIYLFWKI